MTFNAISGPYQGQDSQSNITTPPVQSVNHEGHSYGRELNEGACAGFWAWVAATLTCGWALRPEPNESRCQSYVNLTITCTGVGCCAACTDIFCSCIAFRSP